MNLLGLINRIGEIVHLNGRLNIPSNQTSTNSDSSYCVMLVPIANRDQ